MSVTYRIKEWSKTFEKASTRRLDKLSWISVPVKHDGLSYKTLMSREDGPIVFAAWVLILQVAAKCPERGKLENDRGPLTAHHLSMMTGAPEEIFETALQVLCLPEIAWLEAIGEEPASIPDAQSAHTRRIPDAQSMHTRCAPQDRQDRQDRTEQDRTEQDRTEQTGEGASAVADPSPSAVESELVEAWNGIDGVTHVVAMNPSRRKAIKARMNDRVFRERWRDAIEKVRGSPFCLGDNDRNWRATFDWFLRPGTVAKAIEGQYDSRRKNGTAVEAIGDYLSQFGGRQ